MRRRHLFLLVAAALAGSAAGADGPPLVPATAGAARDEKLAARDAAWDRSESLYDAGKLREALAESRNVTAMTGDLFPQANNQLLDALSWQGKIERELENFTAAVATQRRLIAGIDEIYGPRTPQMTDAVSYLDELLQTAALTPAQRAQLTVADDLDESARDRYNQYQDAAALALSRRAMELRGQVLGTRTLIYARSLHNAALVRADAGDVAGALPDLIASADLKRELLGDKHPQYISDVTYIIDLLIGTMAGEHIRQGDLAAAKADTAQAMEMAQATFGDQDMRTRTAAARNTEIAFVAGGSDAGKKAYIALLHSLGEAGNMLEAGDVKQSLAISKTAMGQAAKSCGQTSLAYAVAMRSAALASMQLDDPASAEPLLRASLAIQAERVGRDGDAYWNVQLDLIDTLRRLAGLAVETDKLADAKRRMQEVLALEKERAPLGSALIDDTGRDLAHIGTLMSLTAEDRKALLEATRGIAESVKNYTLGRFTAALESARAGAAVRDRLLPEDDADRLQVDEHLALLLDATRDYAGAVAAFRALRDRCEKLLGAQNPRTGRNMNNLANSLQNRVHELVRQPGADLKAARAMLVESEKLKREIFGDYHPQTLDAQWEIANFDKQMNLPAEGKERLKKSAELMRSARAAIGENKRADADGMFRQAIALDEQAVGKDDEIVASDLMELGRSLRMTGEFGEAEACFLRAGRIRRGLWGINHALNAEALNALGRLYTETANRDRARRALEQALAIRRQLANEWPFNSGAHFADALALSEALNNLAGVLLDQGRTADARRLFEESVDIAKRVYGEDSPIYAGILTNYAASLPPRENNVARRLSETALAVLEKKEPGGVQCASTHGALAALLEDSGDFAGAQKHLEIALQNSLKIFPEESDRIASYRKRMAQLLFLNGEPKKAAAELERAMTGEQAVLRSVFNFSSEADMTGVVNRSMFSLNLMCSLALAAPDDAEAATQALTWVLRRKGIILDALCRLREAQRLNQQDPQVRELSSNVAAMRGELTTLRLNPPAGRDPAALQLQKDRLADQIEDAQRELMRKLSPSLPPQEVDVTRVRQSLPTGSALVEFIRVRITERLTPAAGAPPAGPRYSDHYLAMVLSADAKEKVRVIDLGPADDIESLVTSFRTAMDTFKGDTPERILRSEGDRERDFDALSKQLYDKIFAPVIPAIGKAERIYLAPDGDLSIIPFESLWTGEKYLVETRAFGYLSSGRDLLEPPPAKPGKGTVIFAAADFSATAQQRRAALAAGAPPATQIAITQTAAMRTPTSPFGELRDVSLTPLAGTQGELTSIRRLLADDAALGPVTAYSQAAASEDELKRMAPPPKILHLATHGYFLSNTGINIEDVGKPDAGGAARGLARLRGLSDPLLRSGLVLAGADHVDQDAAGLEDGWVSAAEIAALDLRGTELVVLSACSTGMGDIRDGEGVYGLRRAFKYAGAQSLLVSLFDVPDSATRDLMIQFYTNLKAGQDRLTALHNAQLAILKARRERPDAPGVAHPFFWSSFILSGK